MAADDDASPAHGGGGAGAADVAGDAAAPAARDPPPPPQEQLERAQLEAQAHDEPLDRSSQETPAAPRLPAYRPGKTARRTAGRRAREAAERAAASAAAGDFQAPDRPGEAAAAGLAIVPPPSLEEDSLKFFEEGEEDDPFNCLIPLAVRVETAATAFVRKGKKRRLNFRQEALLRTYLRHGGVKLQKTAATKQDVADVVELEDVPSMCPVDSDGEDDGEEFGKDEMSRQKVVDSDGDDDDGDSDEGEDVRQADFFAVTSSYLSVYILGPESQFVDMEDIREAPRVCEAFLNYLIVRNAAPEYKDEIRRSIDLCKQAAEELPRCKELSCLLPGKFNMACSIRFGGEYYQWLDLRPEDAVEDERVTTVEGVKIFQASDANQSANIEGWGPPPKVDPEGAKKQRRKRTAEAWDQEGETESVLGLTRHEVVKFTSRFHALTEDVPKPERHYSLARVVGPPDLAAVRPPSPEAPIPGANMLAAGEAFFPTKLKLVESAEDDADDSEGATVQVYFDLRATEKLRKGMLLEAAFYKLDSGHWYIGQVAYVLPSYAEEDIA
ncbi:MAG: Argonaute siRNA chaperone complex subunit Arb1-domain-containing protein [Olpidium bornovanus]|uniref:Argonaute siRNA chaperone complex subunit Arb1-domain-containing protein n=1 Tax=Olpidium bornovanus TaxID=278681 RepID=A0A8H8DK47_9FUNG|nr:MAG: Argonaute siRNA chaperone complex subunit Arb1-domain-containing protein [Olpidium bornovanus]